MSPAAGPAPAAWRAVCASRRGSSHPSGVPNQDAVRCERVPRPEGTDVWVAAVADGHGGSRYVRSDVGARTAVDVAVEAVRRAIDASPDEDPAILLRTEVPRMVHAWRDAVREHALAHPFSPEEQARAGDLPSGGEPLTAYGATLLVAVVGESGVAVAQVGDGDALVRSHGFATRPVPGDARLVAGETTSLCLDSAVDDFRYAVLPVTAEPDLVLLATDGYGNSFAQADWWHALIGDVASFVDRLGFHQLVEQLPDWLEESARIGGDDVSAILVVRDPLAVEPEPAVVEEPAVARGRSVPRTLTLPPDRVDAAAPTSATPHWGRTRRGRVLAVFASILAAALIVVGGLMLLGPGVPDPLPTTPADPISTTPPGEEGTGEGDDGRDEQERRRDRSPREREPDPAPDGPKQRQQGQPAGEAGDETGKEEARKPLPGSG